MEINQNRLDTFRSNQNQWPHSRQHHLKIENFAKAGFFLINNKKARVTDLVKCFLCDIELSKWTTTHSPFTRHSMESPSCPWVLLNYPDNRMLIAGTGNTSPKSPLMKTARTATFSSNNYWPPKDTGKVKKSRLQTVSTMVEAGFYYSPTLEHPLRIKCPYCHLSIKQPDLDLNLLNEHKEAKPECHFFKRPAITKSSSASSSSLSSSHTKKKRKVSEPSSTEDQVTKDLDASIWNIDMAFNTSSKHDRLAKVLKTYSKKKHKSNQPHENTLSSLLTFPTAESLKNQFPEQNVLEDQEFIEFAVPPSRESVTTKSSQKGKEKEYSIQEKNVKSMSRISIARKEQELNRYSNSSSSSNKVPERVSLISVPHFETQERTVPISPFRQSKLSSSSLSSTSPFIIHSKSRSRESSAASSSPKASPQEQKRVSSTTRQVTPPLPSHSILSKRALLMQSTPNQSSIPTSNFNLFDDGAFSPIVGHEPSGSHKNGEGSIAASNQSDASVTPLPFGSRTHGLINVEKQQIKKLIPPKSPTRTDHMNNDKGGMMTLAMTMGKEDDIVKDVLYEKEFTEEEKKMTVAEFIKATIEKQVEMIKKHGEERIEEIRRQAEELKREIINS